MLLAIILRDRNRYGYIVLVITSECISCMGQYIVRSFFICQVGCEAAPNRSWIVMQTMSLDCLEWSINRNSARIIQESICSRILTMIIVG